MKIDTQSIVLALKLVKRLLLKNVTKDERVIKILDVLIETPEIVSYSENEQSIIINTALDSKIEEG